MEPPPVAGIDDAVSFLLVRAERVVEAQVARVERLEDKAAQVLRFNAAIMGAVATALVVVSRVSGAPPSPWRADIVPWLPVGALSASTLLGLLAYRSSRLAVGFKASSLLQESRTAASVEDLRRRALATLARMHDHNARVAARMAWLLEAALWAMMVAVAGLALVALSFSGGGAL